MDRVISIASFKGATMTADIGIDQLDAFLARRAIELNCSMSLLALSSHD
jgi:hypothetical protein